MCGDILSTTCDKIQSKIDCIKKRLGQNSFNRMKNGNLSELKFPFFHLLSLILIDSYLLAVYFRKFTAIKAIPISFSTFDFPRTENRVKRKLAFKNPKTGSTSILR